MGLTKLLITVEHTGERLSVLFNPEEYALNQDNNFASQAVPGLSGPLLQFVHGNLRTLETELFFDSFDTPSLPKRDVRDDMNRITGLMAIDPELHAPPVLRVSWASLQFRCVLARAAQRFIMFAEDGTPVRARMNVTFNEFIDADRESKEVSRQTADFTKVHVVVEGETITAIANRMYGSAEAWRPIAIANRLDAPRSLRAGQKLRIPSLPFVDPGSGEVMR
jgi:LysM repeat protein